MRTNELMLGDYVHYYDNVFAVTCISNHGIISLHDVANRETTLSRIDKLCPIPLTAELLRNNMFEVVSDLSGMVMYLSRSENGVIVHAEENRVAEYPAWHIRIMVADRKKDYDVKKNINYLHEFQNMLRLADSPFEIVI